MFSEMENISLAGSESEDYIVTVYAVIGNIGMHSIKSSAKFTLTLKNPCIEHLYVAISQVSLEN